jgi:hypothetical protein
LDKKTNERSNEMIDTAILNFLSEQYRITSMKRFSDNGLKVGKNGVVIYRKFVNNATSEEIEANIYRPPLTLYRRISGEFLKVQFSAPKLIFGNNLEELTEDRFEDVLDALRRTLLAMDVRIEKEVLRNAQVMAFHPSKNIPITGSHTALGIIKDFSKVNLTEKMDLSDTKYRNKGYGIQFHAKSHALTFYDKNKDLTKGEKNGYDADQKLQRQRLFGYLQQKRLPETLRMEVRLSEKQKMNSVLQNLGFNKNPVFADIFKRDVCRKVLLAYFEAYIAPNFIVFGVQDDPQAILQGILRKNPKMKLARAIQRTALIVLCKAEGGTRGLRNVAEPRAGRRTWQRIAAEIKALNRRIPLRSCYGYIKEIKQALQKFEPYKPEIG